MIRTIVSLAAKNASRGLSELTDQSILGFFERGAEQRQHAKTKKKKSINLRMSIMWDL